MIYARKSLVNCKPVSEKIAVMVVTSSADRPQIYSERVRNLPGFNHTKLKQDGGNPARLIQDLLQAQKATGQQQRLEFHDTSEEDDSEQTK